MTTNSNAGSSPVDRKVRGQPDKWMPFESAPNDGKQFIAWNGEEMAILNKPPGCALGRWSKHNGKWYGAMVLFKNPTHWMKKPKAPNVELTGSPPHERNKE